MKPAPEPIGEPGGTRLVSMLSTCCVSGCTTIVLGSGTCVEHDQTDAAAALRAAGYGATGRTKGLQTVEIDDVWGSEREARGGQPRQRAAPTR